MEKRMTISFIGPTRPDLGYHLAQLKPAFTGSDCAKAEWLEMVERVQSGQAGLYLVLLGMPLSMILARQFAMREASFGGLFS